jgi:hypothetical protein
MTERVTQLHIQDDEEKYLNIRFTTGHTLKIHLPHEQTKSNYSDTTVAELKQIVLKACNNSKEQQLRKEATEKPNLRLIFQGKLMQDPMFLSFYNISNGDFIHGTFSVNVQSPSRGRWSRPTGRHSSYQESELSEDPLTPNPRGFDRLREAGFDEQDVLFIRNQFYNSRPHLLTQLQQGRITGEDLRELEEEWMNEDDPQGGMQNVEATSQNNNQVQVNQEAQIYYEGNNFHMYAGILLGFFLGFVVLLLLLEKILPRRMKYGILAGISCNCCFALIRFFMPDTI